MRRASAIIPAQPTTISTSHAQSPGDITNEYGQRRKRAVTFSAAAIAVVALAACSSDSEPVAVPTPTTQRATTTTRPRPTTTRPAPTTTTLPPTTTTTIPPPQVPNLGAPVLTAARLTGPDFVGPELTQEGKDTVTRLMTDYVSRAVAAPVGTGQPADVQAMLSSVLTPRLTAAQRAILTDEGVPRLTLVKTDKFEVAVDGLAGTDGLVGVVNCRLDLQVSGVTADGGQVVTIVRRGDLTYIWEPASLAGGGAWLLDSFNLTVERTLP